jgi:hypothetical protein
LPFDKDGLPPFEFFHRKFLAAAAKQTKPQLASLQQAGIKRSNKAFRVICLIGE